MPKESEKRDKALEAIKELWCQPCDHHGEEGCERMETKFDPQCKGLEELDLVLSAYRAAILKEKREQVEAIVSGSCLPLETDEHACDDCGEIETCAVRAAEDVKDSVRTLLTEEGEG